MKQKENIKELLIDNTIRLIAEGGFEKATTKAITYSGGELSDFKLNEVYIYRIFGSKEHLYAAAFMSLDKQIVHALCKSVESYPNLTTNTSDKLHDVFENSWQFVLSSEDSCRCYVRYYYSTYFKDESRKAHNELFGRVIDDFRPLFKQESDVVAIMHSVFTTLLDFAIRVYNGDLINTENNRSHIFLVLYRTMAIYFNPEISQAG
jgi:AcrR family transcriptional regulator